MAENNYSEQLDHIAHMLNIRTMGKAYENFIVNAIYARVGNPELVPVTQQYVRNPRDPRHYYLLDLYFPQLKYGVEVDEEHHLKDTQIERDKLREEDVRAAIECEEDRISIYDRDGNKRSYAEIDKDIDRVVSIIKKRVSAIPPLKWETNEDRKSVVKNKGVFSVDDDVYYESVTEIYNICGGKRTGKEKGKHVTKLQKCYLRLNANYKLWVPILTIVDEKDVVLNGKNGYENFLSEDKNTLIEKSVHSIEPAFDINYKRVVFMRMRNYYGRQCIRFIGVFELTEESDDKEHKQVYRRIAKEVSIKELMP